MHEGFSCSWDRMFGQCLARDCTHTMLVGFAVVALDAPRHLAEGYQTQYMDECPLHSKNALLDDGRG